MENRLQSQHSVGAQSIGFDYQFYYFMYLILKLRHGQKIGFEVKDDIHIDSSDGTTILFQAKHTIQKNKNLSTLDIDLWKTLNNWIDFIKASGDQKDYIKKHSFILVTNKSNGNNEFVSLFKEEDVDKLLSLLEELKNKTKNETIRKYIANITSLGKKNLKSFLSKLKIETDIDEIISKVKNRILENVRQDKFVDPIFEKLSSNLNIAKYIDIKERNCFEISFEDFNRKFGKCFSIVFEKKTLPKRDFPIDIPEDLESQPFIKQLLDIGEIESGSKYILVYTTQMLSFLRNFTYWSDKENFILLTEAEEFKKDSIQIWINAFRKTYRKIEKQINSGVPIIDIEDDIKELGVNLIDYIREQKLSIGDFQALDTEFSNGHYYALSNDLEIGWHFDWENKYKK
ncbi:hypothetical protein KRX57_04905 [Weeksellaceae bacterium TAE3-ERU29]|nr:hypothetical protein [Weeksellaceae bacterium TAE3-ERU29]